MLFQPASESGSSTSEVAECERGWKEIEGKCYKRRLSRKTFEQAVEACAAEGAVLAMPKTEQILKGLKKMTYELNLYSYWTANDHSLKVKDII